MILKHLCLYRVQIINEITSKTHKIFSTRALLNYTVKVRHHAISDITLSALILRLNLSCARRDPNPEPYDLHSASKFGVLVP
jgi:hypothetical protein